MMRDQETIAARQRALSPIINGADKRRALLATAQWWRLESYRGYPSSVKSYEYYLNLRAKANGVRCECWECKAKA